MVISPKFQEFLDDIHNTAEGNERLFVNHLLIQTIEDAYNLYKCKTKKFDKRAGERLGSHEPVLLAREGRKLSRWVKTHERFPFYCQVIGLPAQEMADFICEVGMGHHELEVRRILKGLQGHKDRPIQQRKKKANGAT